MNSQRSERCESCKRVKGTEGSAKRPARYCWQQHDEACRSAELWHLRNLHTVLERARALISTARDTAEHRKAELELVLAIAVVDTQTPPTSTL
jgi:hypothetical protein